MKRTKKSIKVTQVKYPSAILTGDWHIREDTPICRTDDFWEAQWGKVKFISDLQKKYGCSVFHAGDIFETKNPVMSWKPAPHLLTMAIKHFPDQLCTVYGNHDLPQHSLEQSEKCGVETLQAAGKLKVMEECHWEQEPDRGSLVWPHRPRRPWPYELILVWHVMTYIGKSPWPGCTDLTATQILDKYPQFGLILTGHNHKTFIHSTHTEDRRLLVNPGSLTRQDADQEDHEPCVYLWYAETNTVEQVVLPYEKNVISREHIEAPQQRAERMKAYIEHMNLEWQASIKFKDNLVIHFKENRTPKKIKEMIWASMSVNIQHE